MNKAIYIFLLIFLASCKSKTDSSPFLNHNTEEEKEDTTTCLTGTVLPCPESRVPPTQDDINLFISTRGDNYDMLSLKFENTDNEYERLFFTFVAANKFNMSWASYDLASIFSDIFTKPDIGKHSKEIVLYYFKKVKLDKLLKSQIEHFIKMEGKGEPVFTNGLDDYKLFCPTRLLRKLKLSVIRGDSNSYDKLKKELRDKNEEELLLYYAYIMADRYGYQPARKDIPVILQHAFKKYDLGKIDPDTQYFIDTVTNTTE